MAGCGRGLRCWAEYEGAERVGRVVALDMIWKNKNQSIYRSGWLKGQGRGGKKQVGVGIQGRREGPMCYGCRMKEGRKGGVLEGMDILLE